MGAVAIDTSGIERVEVNVLGGADQSTVNDLSGPDVTDIQLSLAAELGGTTGDNTIDAVSVNATNAADVVLLSSSAGSVSVTGLAATLTITAAEATDTLLVNGLAGDDVLIGGAGNDTCSVESATTC